MLAADLEAIDSLDPAKRLTAAVRSDFDPHTLFETASLLDDERVALIDGLAQLCQEVEVGGTRRHWAMRTPARRAVLNEALAADDPRALFEQIEVPEDDRVGFHLMRVLLGYDISADLPVPSEDLEADLGRLPEANAMLRALQLAGEVGHDWYDPADQRIRRYIAAVEADRALATALPPRLIGRENELDDLRSYRRSVLATDGPWVPTYVLTGPGGAGKSALMSTFVLDERRGGGSGGEGPPVIYLDFDKAAVIDATPLELTFELTRQIGHVDEGLDRRLAGFRELGRELGRSFGADGVDSESGTEFNANRELASILSDWEHRDAPVLVVLDAFEELAGRGSSAVMLVLMWLRGLRDEVGLTQIHAIVSGREVVPDAPYLDPGEAESWFAAETKWELGDLDRADASELLRMLGVSDDLSERLPAVFGGNPLVIKLLARFVERSTQAEIEELIASSADEGAPVGEVGQRFVYRRILERVKNRQVRSLAYPGIALRRVTPELVLEVLAPHLPRTLAVTTLEEAKRVFDELAEHVWLVSRIDDITVVHRQDTRRLLVHGLQSDPDVPTAAIHRSAAEYYERGPDGVPDEVAQLEASYHRGFLGDVPVDRLEASRLLRRLGADLNFWPVEARALLKSNAGADEQLTEKELVSLSGRLLTKSRAARIQQRQMLGDIGGAAYEADRLAQVDELDESPERLNYLFGIGDFDYLTDDARARRMIEAYLVDGVGVSREPRTHHHPWLIATAYRILGKVPERILSEAVVDVIYDFDQRLYATAVAGLVGDEESQRAILPGLDNLVRRPVEGVDELLEYQAIGNLGFGNVPVENLLARSVGAFRFDCLAGVAGYATSSSLADVVERFEASFRSEQPTTSELNAYRKDLGAHELVFPDVRTLRSAPVLLSCLYAPLRTVALGLTAEDQRQIIDLLAIRSIFWPRDQTGADLMPDPRRPLDTRGLTAVIEQADRCALLVELADLLDARARTGVSAAMALGIRRVESALFPNSGATTP